MQCEPLTDILAQTHTTFFDMLSLDVEGAEDLILSSLRLDIFSFGVICAESDPRPHVDQAKNAAVRRILAGYGYLLVRKANLYDLNDYWVHQNFRQIYGREAD